MKKKIKESKVRSIALVLSLGMAAANTVPIFANENESVTSSSTSSNSSSSDSSSSASSGDSSNSNGSSSGGSNSGTGEENVTVDTRDGIQKLIEKGLLSSGDSRYNINVNNFPVRYDISGGGHVKNALESIKNMTDEQFQQRQTPKIGDAYVVLIRHTRHYEINQEDRDALKNFNPQSKVILLFAGNGQQFNFTSDKSIELSKEASADKVEYIFMNIRFRFKRQSPLKQLVLNGKKTTLDKVDLGSDSGDAGVGVVLGYQDDMPVNKIENLNLYILGQTTIKSDRGPGGIFLTNHKTSNNDVSYDSINVTIGNDSLGQTTLTTGSSGIAPAVYLGDNARNTIKKLSLTVTKNATANVGAPTTNGQHGGFLATSEYNNNNNLTLRGQIEEVEFNVKGNLQGLGNNYIKPGSDTKIKGYLKITGTDSFKATNKKYTESNNRVDTSNDPALFTGRNTSGLTIELPAGLNSSKTYTLLDSNTTNPATSSSTTRTGSESSSSGSSGSDNSGTGGSSGTTTEKPPVVKGTLDVAKWTARDTATSATTNSNTLTDGQKTTKLVDIISKNVKFEDVTLTLGERYEEAFKIISNTKDDSTFIIEEDIVIDGSDKAKKIVSELKAMTTAAKTTTSRTSGDASSSTTNANTYTKAKLGNVSFKGKIIIEKPSSTSSSTPSSRSGSSATTATEPTTEDIKAVIEAIQNSGSGSACTIDYRLGELKGLENVNFGGKITGFTLGEQTTKVAENALKNANLTGMTSSLNLQNVTEIGANAFYGLQGLEKGIVLTEKITKIGAEAFKGQTLSGKLRLTSETTSNASRAADASTGAGTSAKDDISNDAIKGAKKIDNLNIVIEAVTTTPTPTPAPDTRTADTSNGSGSSSGTQDAEDAKIEELLGKVVSFVKTMNDENIAGNINVEYKGSYISKERFKDLKFNHEKVTNIIMDNVTEIRESAFEGATISTDFSVKKLRTVGNKALKNATINGDISVTAVESVGESSYEGATINGEILVDSLKTIGGNAFKGAKMLYNMALPRQVTTIGASAFEGMKRINESSKFVLVIPANNSITSVGTGAFKGITVNLSEGIEISDTLKAETFKGATLQNPKFIAKNIDSIKKTVDLLKENGTGDDKIGFNIVKGGIYEGVTINLTGTEIGGFSGTSETANFAELAKNIGGENGKIIINYPKDAVTVKEDAFKGVTGLGTLTLSSTQSAHSTTIHVKKDSGARAFTGQTITGTIPLFTNVDTLDGANLDGVIITDEITSSNITDLTNLLKKSNGTAKATGSIYVNSRDEAVIKKILELDKELTNLNIKTSSIVHFTYENESGTDVNFNSQVVREESDTIKSPGTPSKTGYNFVKWYLYKPSSPTDESTTLENIGKLELGKIYTFRAKFEKETYNVTFDVDGGASSATNLTQNVKYQDKATEPTAPTKAGHTFEGWYKVKEDGTLETTKFDFTSTPITANTKLKAKYTINKMTVEFLANGGTITVSNSSSRNSTSGGTGNTNSNTTTTTDKYTQQVDWNTSVSSVLSGNITATKNNLTFAGWYLANENGDFILDENGDPKRYDLSSHVTSNLKLKAGYTATVTFKTGIGDASTTHTTQTVFEGKKAKKPTNPSRTDAAFVSWVKSDGTESGGDTSRADEKEAFDFETPVTGNMTLTASWKENAYNLNFETNGGSSIDSTYYSSNQVPSQPETPTRAGYTFIGWYLDENFTTPYAFLTPLTANTTLYAKWKIKSYKITVKDDDGNTLTAISVSHTDIPERPLSVEKELSKKGYTFAGWVVEDEETGERTDFDFSASYTTAKNITIKPKWEANSYTVTFYADRTGDSSYLGALTVKYGSTVDSKELKKINDKVNTSVYSFEGWEDENKNDINFDKAYERAENLKVYAKLEELPEEAYEVKVKIGSEEITKNYYESKGFSFLKSLESRSEKVFEGWYLDENFEKAFVESEVSKDEVKKGGFIVYGKFRDANKYNITFKSNGGSITKDGTSVSKLTLIEGQKLSTEDLSVNRTGYIFGGWYLDASLEKAFDADAVIEGQIDGTGEQEVTLYAKWTEETKYTITLMTNGGSTPIRSVTLANGQILKNYITEPVKTGYTFGGWYTDSAFTDEFDIEAPLNISSNINLWAKWNVKVAHKVTFETNGGGSISPVLVKKGETIKIVNPSRDGYTFEGWYSDSKLTQKYDINREFNLTTDITLYANWTKSTSNNSGTISGGSGGGSSSGGSGGGSSATTSSTSKQEVKEESKQEVKEEVKEEVKKEETKDNSSNRDKGNSSIKEKVEVTSSHSFIDVKETHWASDAINTLAEKGIVSGVSDDIFTPEGNTTRADLAIMLVRYLGIEGTASTNFNDVSEGKYYYNFVGLAKENGLINGYSDNTFKPEEKITRQDAMVMIANVLENYLNSKVNKDTSILGNFKDSDLISSYARESVAVLVNKGIIVGNDGKLNPSANITRAEVSVIIYKLINLIN